jgi:DNA-binding IclR family transcriptional regulator
MRDKVSDKISNIKEDRHFVTALSRGLDVLACFKSGQKLLGNMDIANRCNLPKSTVSRLTYTLTKLGYLTYVEEFGKYRLGSAMLSLGSSMLSNPDIRMIARPLMQELADETQAMVSLASRDRLSMIYIENARSSSALTLSLEVGSRIPLATSAIGRAYLSVASEKEIESVFTELKEADPKQAEKLIHGIQNSKNKYQELGCTFSFGDWQKDVNAIAVPFRPGNGMPIMAINCGGPAFNLSPEYLLDQVRPKLLVLVQRLQSHGWR